MTTRFADSAFGIDGVTIFLKHPRRLAKSAYATSFLEENDRKALCAGPARVLLHVAVLEAAPSAGDEEKWQLPARLDEGD